jgi:hypothetical protein
VVPEVQEQLLSLGHDLGPVPEEPPELELELELRPPSRVKPLEDPELEPEEEEEGARGHVPPEQVAPTTAQLVHGPPPIPHAVSDVPLTQVPVTSQQPLQPAPQVLVPLLPPLAAPLLLLLLPPLAEPPLLAPLLLLL